MILSEDSQCCVCPFSVLLVNSKNANQSFLCFQVDRFLEFLMPPLIQLVPNSAKIMATSGLVCLKFILQNTFSPRFIPIICSSSASKSKEIRRHICEFLDIMLHTWPTHNLEKHVALLQDAIKKGISDADPDARTFARKAYWGFADHFKDQADSLMSSLDPSYKRLLQGEMSQSSSSNSLNILQVKLRYDPVQI